MLKKKTTWLYAAISVILVFSMIPLCGCERQEYFDRELDDFSEDYLISVEIQNLPTDPELPTEVVDIIQYLFSVKEQAFTDAFFLENKKNTLLEKKHRLKSQINERILERENEKIYEIQRYYVLGSGTDYYASCDLEYYCAFYEQYTDSDKLYVVITDRVIYTEPGGTIATSDGTTHTLEFIYNNNSYFLNNDAYTDIDFTCSMVDENGVVTKNLQYPEVDLEEIVSDPNYNKPDPNKKRKTNNTHWVARPKKTVDYSAMSKEEIITAFLEAWQKDDVDTMNELSDFDEETLQRINYEGNGYHALFGWGSVDMGSDPTCTHGCENYSHAIYDLEIRQYDNTDYGCAPDELEQYVPDYEKIYAISFGMDEDSIIRHLEVCIFGSEEGKLVSDSTFEAVGAYKCYKYFVLEFDEVKGHWVIQKLTNAI